MRARLSVIWMLLTPLVSHSQELVTHPSNEVSSLSVNTLRSIFLMRITEWENGQPIKVFVLPNSNKLHADFCKSVLATFPYQLKNSWDRLVFSGTGQAPEMVSSVKELAKKIKDTPGAIGYVSEDELDGSLKKVVID